MTGEICQGPECCRPAMRGGFCAGHVKQRHRGLPLTPLRDASRTPLEQAIDAFDVLMQAENDEDYTRARWNVDRALRLLASHNRVAALQEGYAAARRRGVSIGRRTAVDPARAAKLAAKIGPRRAALRLGISLRTVWRYIRRVTES